MSWTQMEWLLLDTETTSPEPTDARLVTATVVELDEARTTRVHEWVINPGVPVPDEAAEIHGYTTERVRTEGGPPAGAVDELARFVVDAWDRYIPVVAFNASFDLTVITCEMGRHLGTNLPRPGPVLDPFVIDKACDRYRRGRRTLTAACEQYQVRHDGAHESYADAIAAGRVLWRLARVFPHLAAMTLSELQPYQAKAYAESAASLERHIRKVKADEERPQKEIDAVSIPREWPIRTSAEAVAA